MSTVNFKPRFYTRAAIEQEDLTGFFIFLDQKKATTPFGKPLFVPCHSLAMKIAEEFNAQDKLINPLTMPVTRIILTAIDCVADCPKDCVQQILNFFASDLLFYRATSPLSLLKKQEENWNPVLEWVSKTFDIHFSLSHTLFPVEQPVHSFSVFHDYLMTHQDPLYLSSFYLIVTLTGSSLLTLAYTQGYLSREELWAKAHIEEDWQMKHWGEDEEALMRHHAKRRDFDAGIFVLDACRLHKYE